MAGDGPVNIVTEVRVFNPPPPGAYDIIMLAYDWYPTRLCHSFQTIESGIAFPSDMMGGQND